MRNDRVTTLRLIAFAPILAALLAACTTLPNHEPAASPASQPAWVTTPPKATNELTYFVGTGSDASNNAAAAEEKAIQSLAGKVAASIGAAAGAQPTPATRSDLKGVEQRVEGVLRGSIAAKLPGFRVADRWVDRRGDRVTVYLLAQYASSALAAQRSRLAALVRERTDPVAVPQTRGEELLSNGKPYEAAVQFMQAALAAARTENGAELFQTNIKKAEAAVAEIRVDIVTNDLRGRLDQQLPEPFRLDVNAGGNRNRPVTGARFRITFPVSGENGAVGTATMTATSDARGRVSIELPSPRLFGNQTVTAALDLSPELEPLLHAAGADKELVSSLKQAIASVRAVLHYRTTSLAASIPTGVLVMDLDRGGNPISEDDTAAGIENALSQAGFHILPIPSNRSIFGIDMPDLVTILRNNFGSKIQRAIVGHARISGFEHTDGNYVVKVTGHIEVADLESGKVLFSTDQVKLSRASDASSAINAAFKGLGISIGKEIKNRLR